MIPNPYQHPNDFQKNWVGKLQKLTQRNLKCVPEYEFSQPEDRIFECKVTVGSEWEATGQGRSKQDAKRMAAYILHQQLEEHLQNSHSTVS